MWHPRRSVRCHRAIPLSAARYVVANGAASPTFGGTVSTTGSTVDPVMRNGSSWIYGYLLDRDLGPAAANGNLPFGLLAAA